jgi:signal transduction histidine kinase
MVGAGDAMSFRRRLLLLFALTVLVSVAAVTVIVSTLARRAFDRANDERTTALVAQFRREFARRGEDVAQRVESVAASNESKGVLVAAAQKIPDYSPFLETAQAIAENQRLDFLEFADEHGAIVSSAQWPAKFGYNEPLVSQPVSSAPFLKEEELPSGPALGVFAVRTIGAAGHQLYVIGGIRLDKSFLESVEPPAGMSVALYENLGQTGFAADHLISAASIEAPEQLAPIVRDVQRTQRESSAISPVLAGGATVNAFPLTGNDHRLLGVLLVSSSRQIYTELRSQIRAAALVAAGAGLALAMILSSWLAARITHPVEQLARVAREVSGGNWNATVEASTHDELGELAESFNCMTRDLRDHEQRLVQAERVAAWRDLARRLAHELKNPLFPLQLTVENLLRAREQGQEQFDETFRESATTLLAEISNLKNIVARFSDFSKMPEPHFQPVKLSELMQDVIKLYQAQLANAHIESAVECSVGEAVPADPDLLHRALSNLVINAIEAMPTGGKLTLRAGARGDFVRMEVSDTGIGFSPQESANLFTPYFTTKPQGTGLGLAIVQSIVSDHGGTIRVESEPGKSATFIIDLPARRDKQSGSHASHVQESVP